eukprot:UN11313
MCTPSLYLPIYLSLCVFVCRGFFFNAVKININTVKGVTPGFSWKQI